MLEMLSEVISSEEFFGLIAFAEFVHVGQVFNAAIPVGLRVVGKFFTTVAT